MMDSNIFLVNIFLLILNIERRLTTGDIVPALACPAVFVGRFLRGSRAPNQDGRVSCFPKETAQGLGAKYTAKMAGLEAVQSIGDTLF